MSTLAHVDPGNVLSHSEYVDPNAHTLDSGVAGEILYYDGSDIVGLSPGTNGYVLTMSGGLPAWAAVSAVVGAGNLDMQNNLILNIGAAGTDFTAGGGLQLAAGLGIGVAPSTSAYITNDAATGLTSGTTQYGFLNSPTFSSAATTAMRGYYVAVRTAAAAYVTTVVSGLFVDNVTKGAGHTITTQRGIYVNSQTQGGTNNYGVYIEAPSGGATANIGLYNAGTTTLVGAVTFSGQIFAGDGSAGAPGYAFASDPDLGIFRQAADTLGIQVGGATHSEWRLGDGTLRHFYDNGANARISIGRDLGGAALAGIAFGSGGASALDTYLVRDAANTLAQRNGANAQVFRVYNTYATAGADFERGRLGWLSNEFRVGTDQAGTGTARALVFETQGNGRWQVSTAGHLLAYTDNTYDIGASAATRPRNLYLAGAATILGGNLGIGTGPNAAYGALISTAFSSSSRAIEINSTFMATANSDSMFGIEVAPTFAEASRTSLTLRGISIASPITSNVTNSTTLSGLYISAQTGAHATNYGVYIEAPSGATANIGLYNAGTTFLGGVLSLSNAIGSLTGVADVVRLGAYDLSAGNATLSIATETAVTVAAAGASDAYLDIRLNGTTYKLLLHT